MSAADDDGNGDKPWFKKKTLWASVATMVSKFFFVHLWWEILFQLCIKHGNTKILFWNYGNPNIAFKQSEPQLTKHQATVLALFPASVSANASQEAAAASMKAAKAAGKSAEASTRAANATEKSSRAVVGTSMANKHIDNRGNYCGPTDHFKGRNGGSQRGSRSR